MIYAYLRVSTVRQDLENQRHGLMNYCRDNGIEVDEFFEDTASASVQNWRERGIGEIISKGKKGDVVIVAEVSRMARTTLQVLEIIKEAAEKKISVIVVKGDMRFDSSMQSTIMATILGLAAEIERDFISARTKEALARRKAKGLPMGRKVGWRPEEYKLDKHRADIIRFLDLKIGKAGIARMYDVSKSTLYEWLKRQGLDHQYTDQKRGIHARLNKLV